ncbi:putative zinc ribbon protein [Enterobacter sp. 342]
MHWHCWACDEVFIGSKLCQRCDSALYCRQMTGE